MKSIKTLRDLADKLNIRLGSCINANALENDPAYACYLAQEFNMITPENALKFGAISPRKGEYDFRDMDRIIAFAKKNDMVVRGHVLVWDHQLPSWLLEGEYSRAELVAILQQHITTLVHRYSGSIAIWDVVNEAVDVRGNLRETFWYQRIGEEYIDIAFRAARQADASARLFYNDYGAEAGASRREGIYQLVSRLKNSGVPIDGVGFQMHLTLDDLQWQVGHPLDIRSFALLGLECAITEVDVRMKLDPLTQAHDRGVQAGVYAGLFRDYVLAGGCESFILWGFTDRYSWIPFFYKGEGGATITDEDYVPKPAYDALFSQLKQGLEQKQASEINT